MKNKIYAIEWQTTCGNLEISATYTKHMINYVLEDITKLKEFKSLAGIYEMVDTRWGLPRQIKAALTKDEVRTLAQSKTTFWELVNIDYQPRMKGSLIYDC